LLNYENTGGHDDITFGHPKKYSEIVLTFLFWLLQILGGIGLFITNNTGLKFGLISNLIAGIFTLIYSIFISNHKLNYTTKISTNGIEKEMLTFEKWKLIYSEPLLYISMTMFLFYITFLIIKRLKFLKNEKTYIQHRV